MKPVQVLALGKFRPEDLLVSVSESNRKISPAIEAQVDALWEATRERAASEGRVCYNGTSYRLNTLSVEGDTIKIDFGLLEYKAREALPSIPGYFDLSDEFYRKVLNVFTGPSYTAFRQRAQIGIEDVRARRVSLSR